MPQTTPISCLRSCPGHVTARGPRKSSRPTWVSPLSPFPISMAPQRPHFALLLADSNSQILCGPFKSSLFMNIRWCLKTSVGPSIPCISLYGNWHNINCHGPRKSLCFITILWLNQTLLADQILTLDSIYPGVPKPLWAPQHPQEDSNQCGEEMRE